MDEVKTGNSEFKVIDLNINFTIPNFHKSLITPIGEIFITGGSNNDYPSQKSNLTYVLNFKTNSLLPVAQMLNGRSSHTMCY